MSKIQLWHHLSANNCIKIVSHFTSDKNYWICHCHGIDDILEQNMFYVQHYSENIDAASYYDNDIGLEIIINNYFHFYANG